MLLHFLIILFHFIFVQVIPLIIYPGVIIKVVRNYP